MIDLTSAAACLLRPVRIGPREWWYLGPEASYESARALVDEEVRCGRSKTKEPTAMQSTYRSDPGKFVGWWCLDKGASFLVFTKGELAEKFKAAL